MLSQIINHLNQDHTDIILYTESNRPFSDCRKETQKLLLFFFYQQIQTLIFQENMLQWNLNLTKYQGTGGIGSLYHGFVLWKTLI